MHLAFNRALLTRNGEKYMPQIPTTLQSGYTCAQTTLKQSQAEISKLKKASIESQKKVKELNKEQEAPIVATPTRIFSALPLVNVFETFGAAAALTAVVALPFLVPAVAAVATSNPILLGIAIVTTCLWLSSGLQHARVAFNLDKIKRNLENTLEDQALLMTSLEEQSQLIEQWSTHSEEFASTFSTLGQDLENEYTRLKSEWEEHCEILAQKECEFDSVKQAFIDLETLFDKKSESFSQLEQNFSELIASFEKERGLLVQTIKEYKELNTSAEKDKERMENNYETLYTNIKKIGDHSNQLKEELQATSKTLREREKAYQELEQKLTAQQEQLQVASKAPREQLEQKPTFQQGLLKALFSTLAASRQRPIVKTSTIQPQVKNETFQDSDFKVDLNSQSVSE